MSKKLVICAMILAFASGCLKEEQNLSVHGDGSGKIKVSHVFVGQFAALMGKRYRDKSGNIHPDAKFRLLADLRDEHPGVTAWADAGVEFNNNKLYLSGTGYFSDINKLKERREIGHAEGPFEVRSYQLKTDDKGMSFLEMTISGPSVRINRLKKMSKEDRAKEVDRQMSTFNQMFPEFLVTHSISLAGEVQSAKNLTKTEAGQYQSTFSLKDMKSMLNDLTPEVKATLAVKFTNPKAPDDFVKEFNSAQAAWDKIEAKVDTFKQKRKKRRQKK